MKYTLQSDKLIDSLYNSFLVHILIINFQKQLKFKNGYTYLLIINCKRSQNILYLLLAYIIFLKDFYNLIQTIKVFLNILLYFFA